MVGLELEIEGAFIVDKVFEKGILMNCTAGKVLRFLPPLIIGKEDLQKTVDILDEVFQEVLTDLAK